MVKKHLGNPRPYQGKKVKVSPEQLNTERSIEHPVFCFRYLHNNFNLDNCSDEQKITLLKKLEKLSQLTWNQIQLAPKHGLGAEKIYTNSIHPSMPSFLSEDVSYLLAFRCFGLMPVLGHRNGPVLHLLYLDPSGKVYDH